MGRQDIVDGAPGDSSRISGFDAAGARTGAPGEEIAHELGRRMVFAAAGAESGLLTGALQADALEGVISREVFGCDVDEQCGVRVAAVAGVHAGAVGDDPAFFARGSNDLSARAHAEGEHAAAVWKVGDEAVRGGAERRVARRGAIEGTVYIHLQVLDAHTHGEGLALECDAEAGEHFENIASGMATSEDDVRCGNGFPPIGSVEDEP